MLNLAVIVSLLITILINPSSALAYKSPFSERGKTMNQKCFLCHNIGAKIIERSMGFDGNHVNCPECTHYKISRNALNKLMHGYEVPASLSNKVRSHYEKAGEPYEISTITLSTL